MTIDYGKPKTFLVETENKASEKLKIDESPDDYAHHESLDDEESDSATDIKVKVSGCVRDVNDHLPKYLLEVFKHPKKYLEGPLAHTKAEAKHFIVVGAGIAGVLSAYLLLQVGHKVTMLESSDRIGGRIFTHYGDGFYADLGAMRFPPSHLLLHGIVEELKIPLRRFPHESETEQSYFYINDKYYSVSDLGRGEHPEINEEKLMEVYKLFQISKNEVPRNTTTGKMLNPFTLNKEIMKAKLSLRNICKDDKSLGSFIRNSLRKRKLTNGLMNFWGTLDLLRTFFGYSAIYFLSLGQTTMYDLQKKDRKYNHWTEIVNGTSTLPNTLMEKIKTYKSSFKLKTGSPVRAVEQEASGKVKVLYGTSGEVEGDHVIMTPTLQSQKLIKFKPSLPYMKKLAMDVTEYTGSVKIILVFTRPFWAEKNKIAEIKFTGAGAGGTGISDSILRATYYPAHEQHGAAIIASYTWDLDSDIWLSMTDQECIDRALELIVEVHGKVAKETFKTGVVQKWLLDDHTHAAFIQQGLFQKEDYQLHLSTLHGNISFSGEFANKVKHGWVESALESALRSLVKLWPNNYKKEFGKAEAEIIASNGTKGGAGDGQDYILDYSEAADNDDDIIHVG